MGTPVLEAPTYTKASSSSHAAAASRAVLRILYVHVHVSYTPVRSSRHPARLVQYLAC
jgi:hypothetical protein